MANGFGWRAQVAQHRVAQSGGIALAAPCKLDDPARDLLPGAGIAIELESQASVVERNGHCLRRLRLEYGLTLEEREDGCHDIGLSVEHESLSPPGLSRFQTNTHPGRRSCQ